MEIWKSVPKYEEYFASTTGKIKSTKQGRCLILRPCTDRKGYLQVCLYGKSKPKVVRVHKVIAWTFLNNLKYTELQVNHIDGIKSNNALTNLELVTPSENLKHCFRIGNRTHKGENHPYCKLSLEAVKEIRRLRKMTKLTYREIGERYGVGKTHIHQIITRKIWNY